MLGKLIKPLRRGGSSCRATEPLGSADKMQWPSESRDPKSLLFFSFGRYLGRICSESNGVCWSSHFRHATWSLESRWRGQCHVSLCMFCFSSYISWCVQCFNLQTEEREVGHSSGHCSLWLSLRQAGLGAADSTSSQLASGVSPAVSASSLPTNFEVCLAHEA